MLLRGIESEIADSGPFLSLCSEAGHSVSSLPSFPWALLLRQNLGPGTPSSAGTLNNTETDTLPPSRLAAAAVSSVSRPESTTKSEVV